MFCMDTAAYTVARFQHQHLQARSFQHPGGGESGVAGTCYDDIVYQ